MEHITTNITPEAGLMCRNCNGTLQPDEKFCGYCGHEVPTAQDHVQGDVFQIITPTLIYYFVTLILLSVYKLTEIFADGIEGLVMISVIDITIVLVFWIYFNRELRPLFSIRNLNVIVVGVTVLAAFTGAIAVNGLANLINVSLFDDVYYIQYLFEDTDQPLVWAIVMTCLQPAIFEEVAFRGFMFTNLQGLASPRGAVFISAILFGIMHLSFISLLWLVPLGIAFAMMRLHYNTLWYGIIGHFVYNFTITLVEFYL